MVHHGHHHHSNRVIYVIPTPSSTPHSLVFPYDVKARKFSTSSYIPLQTQNRATIEEIEQFLEQINAPIKEWYDEFGFLQEGSAKITCLAIICGIFIPLLFFSVCWMVTIQKKANEKLREISEKAKLLIRDNSQQFIDKGLLWNVPAFYPQYIELWTSLEGPPPQVGFSQPGFQQPDIQTMSMPQQNYQNMQQNQYNGNTFNI